MNVNGSSSIYSLWLKNIQYQKTPSDNNESVSSNFSMGSDSVTISQAALSALLGSDGEMQNEDFASDGGAWTRQMEDSLNELNASGILSDEELETVKNALSTAMQAPPPPPPRGGEQELISRLDELVSAGSISEDQESAILEALQPGYQDGTAAEDNNPFEDILNQLVSYATISEEQKDSILEAFSSIAAGNVTL